MSLPFGCWERAPTLNFRPCLYVALIRAARASAPVSIDRKKNWCWHTDCMSVRQKRPIAMPTPRPMFGLTPSPWCAAYTGCQF